MASPHVAGAAALLLQARPRTPAQAVRGILQNSADPEPWWGNPALGFLDNVHRQGAGMLDIDDAILATTKIEPGKIAAGESESGPVHADADGDECRRGRRHLRPVARAGARDRARTRSRRRFFNALRVGSLQRAERDGARPAASATVNVTITANSGLR